MGGSSSALAVHLDTGPGAAAGGTVAGTVYLDAPQDTDAAALQLSLLGV